MPFLQRIGAGEKMAFPNINIHAPIYVHQALSIDCQRIFFLLGRGRGGCVPKAVPSIHGGSGLRLRPHRSRFPPPPTRHPSRVPNRKGPSGDLGKATGEDTTLSRILENICSRTNLRELTERVVIGGGFEWDPALIFFSYSILNSVISHPPRATLPINSRLSDNVLLFFWPIHKKHGCDFY